MPWGSELNIIGVVKDFHFKSLHYKIEPLIMLTSPSNNLFIRMKPGNTTATIESVIRIFQSYDPGLPIDLHFLDNDFNFLYKTEQRIGIKLGYFSFMAIIISCLGLIGLSLFMTERRTKEIGIRKANGAKSIEIFSLLSGEYAMWVFVSIVIACPVAWFVMNKWLQKFAYRTNMSWWVFGSAGFIALVIAMLTVGFQSYKAAGKNPVESLRYE